MILWEAQCRGKARHCISSAYSFCFFVWRQLTNSIRDCSALIQEVGGSLAKAGYMLITRPSRRAHQPKRFFFVVHSGTGSKLSFVLPAIVGLGIMSGQALDFFWKIKEGFRQPELRLNLFPADAVVN